MLWKAVVTSTKIVAIKVNPVRGADFPGEYIFNINMYYLYQIGKLKFY